MPYQPLYLERLNSVQDRIAQACVSASRQTSEITLLAVSKRHAATSVEALYQLGLGHFGENIVREGVDKLTQLSEFDITWHFIGPLQSNKTRLAAAHFDWIQSLDRKKIADRLSRQRPADKQILQVLVQVNIDKEPQKGGIDPGEVDALAAYVSDLPGLNLRGLMAIPRAGKDPAEQRQGFARMRKLFEHLQRQYPDVDTLSMGMSADLEAAISEGSTMVRVGTDLFGQRNQED